MKIKEIRYQSSKHTIPATVFFSHRRRSSILYDRFHIKVPEFMSKLYPDPYIVADTLEKIQAEFNKLCKAYEDTSIKAEMVIMVNTKLSRGKYFDNNLSSKDRKDTVKIPKKMLEGWEESVYISLDYSICEKQILSIGEKEKITYYEICYKDGKPDVGSPLRESPLILDKGCFYSSYDVDDGDIEIPFTEENYNFILSLTSGFYKLIDKLIQKLGTKETLLEAINSNIKLLNQ